MLRRWQGELPGVGPAYNVSLDMLRGIAIQKPPSSSPRKESNDEDVEEEEMRWKYYPANKLSMDPAQRFAALFKQKEQWELEDLEPYLDHLVKNSGSTTAEILMHYTTTSPSPKKGRDGKNAKLYSIKC